jgi:hypothetical protein
MPPFPELRDISPPPAPGALESILESPERVAALLWVAVVALGAVTALIWWLRVRQRKPKFPPLPPVAATAALRRLEELRLLAPSLPAGELAGAVHETLRGYLHRARGVLARYRTTDELAGPQGADAPPALPFIRGFLPVLNRCDGMRYGATDERAQSRQALVDEAIAAVTADQRVMSEPRTTPQAPSGPTPPPLPAGGEPSPNDAAATERSADADSAGIEPGSPPPPAGQSPAIFTRAAGSATPVPY